MLDISSVLEEIKASPYKEMIVTTPRSGVLEFPSTLKIGDSLHGPLGNWKEKPGTALAVVTREKNPQTIFCQEKGQLSVIHTELHGKFVEAGTEIIRFKHFLSRDEVVQIILKKALHLFLAPERAKYYFIPSVDTKIKVSGSKSITVREGEDLFILSRMKRETSLKYTGPEGVIYAVYFNHNENIEAGEPLIGICSPELIDQVEEVIMRVKTEWKEYS